MATEYNITDETSNMNKTNVNNNTEIADMDVCSTNCEQQLTDEENLIEMADEYSIFDNLSEMSLHKINDDKTGDEEQKDKLLMKNCLEHSLENKSISEIPLNETKNKEFDKNSVEVEKNTKQILNEEKSPAFHLNTNDTSNELNTGNHETLESSCKLVNFLDTFNETWQVEKKTKQTLNEEEMSFITSSLNEQNGLNKMDFGYDDQTLGYSREVINEDIHSEDIVTILCDETLEDLQNEIPENDSKSNKNVLNNIKGKANENVLNREEKYIQDWSILPNETRVKEKVKRMQSVFGLLCMSFNKGPYEFTLANMSHYISGECDENNDWLNNLDSYIQSLNITHLYVTGYNQSSIISNYVRSAKIKVLNKQFIPNLKYRCPKCFRYGCSTYKVTRVLRYNLNDNFNYFEIPCIFKKLSNSTTFMKNFCNK